MSNQQPSIESLQQRNTRVELDKAWETSGTRKMMVAGITYLTASLFLWLIDNPSFYINAIVPTGGYLLSTLSLPWAKRQWIKAYKPD